jgi:hypothetical protein
MYGQPQQGQAQGRVGTPGGQPQGMQGQGPGVVGNYLPNVNGGNYTTVQEEDKIYALVIDLMDANSRESSLLELSKKREQYDELALVLWHSFG